MIKFSIPFIFFTLFSAPLIAHENAPLSSLEKDMKKLITESIIEGAFLIQESELHNKRESWNKDFYNIVESSAYMTVKKTDLDFFFKCMRDNNGEDNGRHPLALPLLYQSFINANSFPSSPIQAKELASQQWDNIVNTGLEMFHIDPKALDNNLEDYPEEKRIITEALFTFFLPECYARSMGGFGNHLRVEVQSGRRVN